ncbi:MAG: endonuclease MutS2 [Anaerolineae bacterium]|nr:endonuclease MutS2 [Anaerolineae bacterium]
MNDKSWQVLEYPKILHQLAEHTSFSLGHELALKLRPSSREDVVAQRLQETTEARTLLDTKPSLSLGGVSNLRPLLKKARLQSALTAGELLDVRTTQLSAASLRRAIAPLHERFPNLAARAEEIEAYSELPQEIGRAINDRAEVIDGASPALARIRQEVNEVHEELLDKLERIVSSSANTHFLQEQLITERHGRYVIPLKADFKGRIPGVVHDQSSSGATLFIEPLATLDLNNQWRQLQVEEEREVERILKQLTARVAQEEESIARTLRALALLDLAFAKARYSLTLGGMEPELVPFREKNARSEPTGAVDHPGSTVRLLQARHPLLPPSEVVPMDVHLGEGFFILVITGPNTGGKTVCLKTVGLLALMAQSGLHIPAADGSALSVFRGVYADIGEEQSIEQSLSTFSSHMTRIVDILRHAYRKSLILLDELGAGTDPVEGSALARAILDHLLKRRITTLVATHYSDLKVYAHSTPGVENASVEFDPVTLAPTYKLSIGLPGRSNALAIASRLGLAKRIVTQAAQSLAPEDLEVESLLTDIKAARDEAVVALQATEAARAQAEEERRELESQRAQLEGERRELLNQARQQARLELAEVRKQLQAISRSLKPQALPRELAAAREKLKEVEKALPPVEPPVRRYPLGKDKLRLGQSVWVEDLKQRGQIIDFVDEQEVEVGVGKFRVKASIGDLELLAEEPEPERGYTLLTAPVSTPARSLHLRGWRAEEALLELDKYLDQAALAHLPDVRIVHGKGTGTLRRLVRDQLRDHPLVAAYRTGLPEEGGDGVTVVELKD